MPPRHRCCVVLAALPGHSLARELAGTARDLIQERARVGVVRSPGRACVRGVVADVAIEEALVVWDGLARVPTGLAVRDPALDLVDGGAFVYDPTDCVAALVAVLARLSGGVPLACAHTLSRQQRITSAPRIAISAFA